MPTKHAFSYLQGVRSCLIQFHLTRSVPLPTGLIMSDALYGDFFDESEVVTLCTYEYCLELIHGFNPTEKNGGSSCFVCVTDRNHRCYVEATFCKGSNS